MATPPPASSRARSGSGSGSSLAAGRSSGVGRNSGRSVRSSGGCEVWHNDDSQTTSPIYTQPVYSAARADEVYANLIGLASTDTRSYLALGFEYLAAISLPGSTTKGASLAQMRARFRSASFFEDFGGQAGGTYAGKVRRAEVPQAMPITGAWGDQVLGPSLTSADARIKSNGGIYYNDQAHHLSICHPYIAECLVDRILGADPYV